MLNKYTALEKILRAREERAKLRQKIALDRTSSISLTLNIPGFPKHSSSIEIVFQKVLNDLKIFLVANRIQTNETVEHNGIDEAGNFYLVALKKSNSSLATIKQQTEQFEYEHGLVRLIDVDVFDENGKPISSGKEKKCMLCGTKSAIECMRNQNHDYRELQVYVFKKIDEYLARQKKEYILRKLSELATKALLYEVSLSPKPGLVDFNSSGAHQDMNYYTFLNSSTALSPFWFDFAVSGLSYTGDLSKALPVIRQIGLKAEQAMFAATQNVNTQKGLIFLLGLAVFITANLSKKTKTFDEHLFIKSLMLICKDLVETELLYADSESKTHGEITFQKFGLKGAGIRFEAQNGFPLIFNHLLPIFEKELNQNTFKDKEKIDSLLITCLLTTISLNNDSNVLYRKGLEQAEQLKDSALLVLKNQKNYAEFCKECKRENISPGGSADMLAVALFFFFAKHELILK